MKSLSIFVDNLKTPGVSDLRVPAPYEWATCTCQSFLSKSSADSINKQKKEENTVLRNLTRYQSREFPYIYVLHRTKAWRTTSAKFDVLFSTLKISSFLTCSEHNVHQKVGRREFLGISLDIQALGWSERNVLVLLDSRLMHHTFLLGQLVSSIVLNISVLRQSTLCSDSTRAVLWDTWQKITPRLSDRDTLL